VETLVRTRRAGPQFGWILHRSGAIAIISDTQGLVVNPLVVNRLVIKRLVVNLSAERLGNPVLHAGLLLA